MGYPITKKMEIAENSPKILCLCKNKHHRSKQHVSCPQKYAGWSLLNSSLNLFQLTSIAKKSRTMSSVLAVIHRSRGSTSCSASALSIRSRYIVFSVKELIVGLVVYHIFCRHRRNPTRFRHALHFLQAGRSAGMAHAISCISCQFFPRRCPLAMRDAAL